MPAHGYTKGDLENFYDKQDPWGYETNPEDQKRIEKLLKFIGPRRFKNALDIGCGNGYVTRKLPAQNIVGIDISEKAICEARNKNKNENIKYHSFPLQNISSIPYNKFDLIIITGVLYSQYIDGDTRDIFSSIKEMLEPNGILITVHITKWRVLKRPALNICEEQISKYRDYLHEYVKYIRL